MPNPIEVDDTSLTVEDLQEALKRDAFGSPPVDQDELSPGEDFTGLGMEPVEEPSQEVQQTEEPVAEPVVEPEPVKEEDTESKQKVLTDEELSNLIVKAKVNGEDVEYSWKDLRDIRQTQDAASQWLERAKAEFKQEREEFKKQLESQPQPAADDEYLTDDERKMRAYDVKIQQIEQNQQNFAETQLASDEERYMRSTFEREGISDQEASERLKRIVDTYPDAATFAAELFTTNPKDANDLHRRKATFNTLWQLNKTIEMPEVVRKVAEIAKEEGKTEAKIEAKRQLTDTVQGNSEIREASRGDLLKDLSTKKSDDAFADFMLGNSVVVKSFE